MASFVMMEDVSGDLRPCLITQQNKFEETNEFTIPGSEVVVKVKPGSNELSYSSTMPIQVTLVEPADDILEVELNSVNVKGKGALRSNANSLRFTDSPSKLATRPGSYFRSVCFRLTVESAWKKEFLNLTPTEPSNVIVRVDGRDIRTTCAILSGKSDVFAAMFTHDTMEKKTGVVEIADFSLVVVREMIRFLMYDYCTLWDGHGGDLAAIADKYNIEGMRALAAEKKTLLVKYK